MGAAPLTLALLLVLSLNGSDAGADDGPSFAGVWRGSYTYTYSNARACARSFTLTGSAEFTIVENAAPYFTYHAVVFFERYAHRRTRACRVVSRRDVRWVGRFANQSPETIASVGLRSGWVLSLVGSNEIAGTRRTRHERVDLTLRRG